METKQYTNKVFSLVKAIRPERDIQTIKDLYATGDWIAIAIIDVCGDTVCLMGKLS